MFNQQWICSYSAAAQFVRTSFWWNSIVVWFTRETCHLSLLSRCGKIVAKNVVTILATPSLGRCRNKSEECFCLLSYFLDAASPASGAINWRPGQSNLLSRIYFYGITFFFPPCFVHTSTEMIGNVRYWYWLKLILIPILVPFWLQYTVSFKWDI